MRTEVKTVTVTCDVCGSPINNAHSHGSVKEKDFCQSCLVTLHREYMRVIEHQVPDRRGGWRMLGEYDG